MKKKIIIVVDIEFGNLDITFAIRDNFRFFAANMLLAPKSSAKNFSSHWVNFTSSQNGRMPLPSPRQDIIL